MMFKKTTITEPACIRRRSRLGSWIRLKMSMVVRLNLQRRAARLKGELPHRMRRLKSLTLAIHAYKSVQIAQLRVSNFRKNQLQLSLWPRQYLRGKAMTRRKWQAKFTQRSQESILISLLRLKAMEEIRNLGTCSTGRPLSSRSLPYWINHWANTQASTSATS